MVEEDLATLEHLVETETLNLVAEAEVEQPLVVKTEEPVDLVQLQ